jgi:acetyl esterase/lipase
MVFSRGSTFSEVMNDPSFSDFGRLFFPVQKEHLFGNTLEELQMTFYNCISPDDTVSVINYLKSAAARGNTIFYNIYTDEEKALDPEKRDTGLFFFKGEPGKPFSVTCAGGGFQFVGAIHGSFPLSLELANMGYNTFALIYRPDAQKSCEDLAKAIEFIFDHAEELEVDTTGYSIWGESAGARMAAFIGSYGTESFGCRTLPRPSAVIMQYTGHREFTKDDPPTYFNAGRQDIWRLDLAMEARYQDMKAAGIPVEIKIYESLPHGYALGRGTEAEGWHKEAVAFWEAYR